MKKARTITVDSKLWEEFKQKTSSRGDSMSGIIELFIRFYVSNSQLDKAGEVEFWNTLVKSTAKRYNIDETDAGKLLRQIIFKTIRKKASRGRPRDIKGRYKKKA